MYYLQRIISRVLQHLLSEVKSVIGWRWQRPLHSLGTTPTFGGWSAGAKEKQIDLHTNLAIMMIVVKHVLESAKD